MSGPPIDMSGLSRYVAAQVRDENDRLDEEVLALLVACVPADELVIVDQQLDGCRSHRTVMTRDQLADYVASRGRR